MYNNSQHNSELEDCFDKLEELSSKIAESITLGNFGEVTKLDMARKLILKKISKDSANLNNNNKNRLRLVWVNNCDLIKNAENLISNNKKFLIKQKKLLKHTQKIISFI